MLSEHDHTMAYNLVTDSCVVDVSLLLLLYLDLEHDSPTVFQIEGPILDVAPRHHGPEHNNIVLGVGTPSIGHMPHTHPCASHTYIALAMSAAKIPDQIAH